MTIYSVFDRQDAARELPLAVADRFSWLAALLPPLYAGAHRLWLTLAAVIAVYCGLYGLSLVLGAGASVALYCLLALAFGFEAPALRRAALRRRGWRQRAEILAADPDLAALEWLKRPEARP